MALSCHTLGGGNTVVVKPSEEAPISAGLLVAEVTAEASFPPGVINVVTHAPGQAATIADEFFLSPDVRCINFTGSVKTGRLLAEHAGRELKRSVMELGGYNALIVLADVDLDYADRVAAFSAFFHQGQICMSARRILVQREIYDEFLARFIDKTNSLPTGDPEDATTIVGPLINPQALATVTERVREAVDWVLVSSRAAVGRDKSTNQRFLLTCPTTRLSPSKRPLVPWSSFSPSMTLSKPSTS
jgi:acyl-CoA reductase-like NAD-dependent aldehyde dehydrogenase